MMMATMLIDPTRYPPPVQPGEIFRITWTGTTTDQHFVQHTGGHIPPDSTIPTHRLRSEPMRHPHPTIPTRQLHHTILTHRPLLTIHTHRPLLTALTTPTRRLHGKVIVIKERNRVHGKVTRTRSTRQINQLLAPLRVLHLPKAHDRQ